MDRRRSELAKIHIARRDLDLADDTYRALLHERYQARSSADLQPGQRADLLQHFKRLGWQPTRSSHPQRKYYATKPQRLIAALWEELYRHGACQRNGLDSYIKSQTGVQRLDWLRQHSDLDLVIRRLRHWLQRINRQQPQETQH